jgi:transposase
MHLMPRRHVSRDMKARIPYLRYVEHFSVKEIERILGVRKTLIYDTLANYQKYGVAYNLTAYTNFPRGRNRKLDSVDIRFVQALLKQEPCMYLDELQDELMNRRNIYVSVPTLLRTLRRLHFSRKHVSIKALERNDRERSAYMNKIGDIITDPAQLIFIDEASRNKKNPTRKIGWSLKGKRCIQRRCFVRGQRFSILPALTMDGIIAHDILPGSITSEKFVQFLRDHVVR